MPDRIESYGVDDVQDPYDKYKQVMAQRDYYEQIAAGTQPAAPEKKDQALGVPAKDSLETFGNNDPTKIRADVDNSQTSSMGALLGNQTTLNQAAAAAHDGAGLTETTQIQRDEAAHKAKRKGE